MNGRLIAVLWIAFTGSLHAGEPKKIDFVHDIGQFPDGQPGVELDLGGDEQFVRAQVLSAEVNEPVPSPRNCLRSSSAKLPMPMTPALLMRTSIVPTSASMRSRTAVNAAWSVTSS